MTVSTGDLVGELKILRKGRGISAAQLTERVGPALRAVCRISDEDDTAEVRRKVSEQIGSLVATLPEDLRTAVLAAFGLHEVARKPFYQERVHWAATELERDDRTIRRRIDEGIERLAELAVAAAGLDSPAVSESQSWHTEELRVALALDQPVPEAFEFRRVVADVDEVAELDLALTLTTASSPGKPVRESDLEVDVFHGGVLTSKALESSDRFGLALRLPKPLRRGERHDVALRFRASMRHPHYVCVPRHPCDLFDLHVRFGHDRPGEIVLLERAFQDDARDSTARGTTVALDNSGEVHVQFRHLAPGFAYGVKWVPATNGSAE